MPKYAEEILSAVWELQRHPTAEQVFLEMKKVHPNIALGTVYKHLNALAEEGQLLRITEPGSPDRYDRTERHDHLICSRCGRISDVRLPDMQSQIQQALGQEILSYDLRIRYICPACREQENKSIRSAKADCDCRKTLRFFPTKGLPSAFCRLRATNFGGFLTH